MGLNYRNRNGGTFKRKFQNSGNNNKAFDFSKQGKNTLEKKKKDTSFTQANFHTTIDTLDPGYSTV